MPNFPGDQALDLAPIAQNLADRMALARADVGDLVIVFQSGAYGASASPQAFLGHPRVAEALV